MFYGTEQQGNRKIRRIWTQRRKRKKEHLEPPVAPRTAAVTLKS